jgi:hypothetical protein
MKRFLALIALSALTAALLVPGAAAGSKSNFVLSGEARGLELAITDQGVTLGLALAKVDSTPRALGVGAGQCTLLGEDEDPENLPCTDDSMVKSAYPGDPGTEELACSGALPAPLDSVLTLKAACGSSLSGINKRGVAFTKSQGKVLTLSASLPVGLNMVPLNLDTEQVDAIVGTITQTLAPVINQAPAEVQQVLKGVEESADETTDEAQKVIDGVLELLQKMAATDALKVEVGTADTKITQDGDIIASASESAGARIGLIGLPSLLTEEGLKLDDADPLENGLVIIEIGTARASATVDRGNADANSAASAALVTVKVRDITSPEPRYVEVSVAPGQTITVLEGTPAESTITAADSVTEQEAGSARAAADAVKLHLLKGVEGGVKLALAGANAAAEADVVQPDEPQNRPPKTLPLTGGTNMTGIALLLVIASAGALALRRRFGR